MYINQRDTQISVIKLYFFSLDALHVSDYISPSSGATFILCTSHSVYAATIRMVPAYTGIYQKRCTVYGLIQSETCRASNGK